MDDKYSSYSVGSGNTIEDDLGVTTSRGGPVRRSRVVGSDVVAISQDIQRHAVSLLETSAPETAVAKLVDAFLPDPIRKAKREAERDLATAEARSQVKIHEAIKNAQVRQAEALGDAFGRMCELQAEEEVGVRAMESATRIGEEIRARGAAFDKVIDAEIADAKTLTSVTARTARAERLQREVDLRAAVEDEVRENILATVRSTRRPT